MHTDFWLERWQQNQTGFHEQETNAHLQKFWKTLNIPKGSKIFVPLCGKSRDILWLLSLDYQVIGVEISPIAVENFFAENKLEAIISETGNFQLWQAYGLSIYIGNFFDLNSQHLPDCSTCRNAQHEMPGPPFSVDENEVNRLFGDSCNIELLFAEDSLQNNDNFKQRGLSSLVEKAYRLSKKSDTLSQ